MQELKLEVINKLKERGAYHTSINGVQHYTRCPYCGDSSNINHSHLGIRIDLKEEYSPMLFHCLKCGVGGILSGSVIEELGLPVGSEFMKELKFYTKKSMKLAKLVNTEKEPYFVPSHFNSAYLYKLDYINERLGTNYESKNVSDLRIILDLKEFMLANGILKKNRSVLLQNDWILDLLQKNYVGFLSTNNNLITFRDVTGKGKYRYYKVAINEKNMNMDSFYSIDKAYDLLYTNEVHVHMAEGIFDILSIRDNLTHDGKNDYYFASCGFGGIVIIKYLIHHYMNTGIQFHIYSDNDKSDWEHKRYLTSGYLTEWLDHIIIHRNGYQGEKDYGIPMERIKDTQISLK